jgi:hypothetical protein
VNKRQIYICHSGHDRAWVQAFADSLKAQGVGVWLDPWQVPVAERTRAALERGFRASDIIAFVITPENVAVPNLFFELGAALAGGKLAVPILPEDLEPSRLPYPLRVRKSLPRESPERTATRLLAETAA